jgi:hypothetical protein
MTAVLILLILSYIANGFHVKSSLSSISTLKMMANDGKLYNNFDALLFDCDG